MKKTTAAITAVGGYVPDFVLSNKVLETMVDTNDEWITTRTGIKERRILKEENAGTSFMAIKAAEDLGCDFTFQLDVTDDVDLEHAHNLIQKKWGNVDVLIHSIAFADRKDLQGRFVDTSRDGFAMALDISAYSLVAMCRTFEDLLNENSSVLAMTYLGATRVITNYNVMGVAKAALEACVRYLASDLGPEGIRVNAISAGPIKTLAASGVSGIRDLLRHIDFKSPLRRNVTQDDVARSALYFASGLSAGVTGEIHFVDSGFNTLGV